MRLNQFEVGDKVYRSTGEGSGSTAHSTIRYIGRGFVVLCPSYDALHEFIVREADGHYGDFERYEPLEDLRQQVRELRTLGFDLYTAIRDAAWTEKLKGPTPHMRSAAENWAAATGE